MNEEPVLELDDIQGNIVPGFKKDSQHFIFLRIVDGLAARAWLKQLGPEISTAREVLDAHGMWKRMRRRLGRDPDNIDFRFINCALSYAAMDALGITGQEKFGDAAFKAGLEQRSSLLGDPEAGSGRPGAADLWQFGNAATRVDVLLILAADDAIWVEQKESSLIASAAASGLRLVHVDHGKVRPGEQAGHEHFGFKDGVSQPAIRGRLSDAEGDFVEARNWPDDPRYDPWRQRYASMGRALVWPGHYLFGYQRQDANRPEQALPLRAPDGPDWCRNGSFLVYRRLNQDVPAFHHFLETAAATLLGQGAAGMSAGKLGALLVGRWPSGWPVMRGADQNGPGAADWENHFAFNDALQALPGDTFPPSVADSGGAVCPFGAHIRKVNPRDDATDQGPMERSLLRSMLRRGIAFGPEMDQPQEERGLLFVSYQASIVDQFEFLTRTWINSERKPKGDSGIDPILANAPGAWVKLNGVGETRLPVPGGWVVPTGGEYLFAPGVKFFSEVL
ncbi:Dyp-type peroxidase [Oxalobacteraceae bacterium]|nr:Dyp-type peroxidase [Oxalobacteraceae bacterium]